MTTIRSVGPGEWPLITDIAHRTWPDTFGAILSPAQIDYMLERMYSAPALARQVAEGHVFLLLRADTVPVGYVSYQTDYLPGTTKIHKLYLLPSTQGRGYGRLLVEAVQEHARAAGQQALRLDVNYQNPAVDFYEHLGFEKIDRVDTEIGNGYLMEDWVMQRSIIPANNT